MLLLLLRLHFEVIAINAINVVIVVVISIAHCRVSPVARS